MLVEKLSEEPDEWLSYTKLEKQHSKLARQRGQVSLAKEVGTAIISAPL